MYHLISSSPGLPELLIAYSKAKSKSNAVKASPYLKPLVVGKMSDRCLRTRLCYTFYSDTILLALPVSWDTELNGNTIRDFPPN